MALHGLRGEFTVENEIVRADAVVLGVHGSGPVGKSEESFLIFSLFYSVAVGTKERAFQQLSMLG